MSGLDERVVRPGDAFFLFLCGGSPKDEKNRLLPRVQPIDHAIRKRLPALVSMGECLRVADGENGIEQQNALLSPTGKIRNLRREGATQVRRKLLENVLQARRFRLKSVRHAKAQADRLALSVVGILTEDHHSYLIVIDLLQGAEDLGALGMDALFRGVFGPQECGERAEVRLVLFRSE